MSDAKNIWKTHRLLRAHVFYCLIVEFLFEFMNFETFNSYMSMYLKIISIKKVKLLSQKSFKIIQSSHILKFDHNLENVAELFLFIMIKQV